MHHQRNSHGNTQNAEHAAMLPQLQDHKPPETSTAANSKRAKRNEDRGEEILNSNLELEIQKTIPDDTNSPVSQLFGSDYLISYILAFVPVYDLVMVRQVSKRMLAVLNDDAVWLQKYIIHAQLHTAKAHIGKHSKGHFRRMYFDRFGRDEQICILHNNWVNTQDEKYIKQLRKVALTSMVYHNTVENLCKNGNLSQFAGDHTAVDHQIVDLVRVSKIVSQRAEYSQDERIPSSFACIDVICSIYSPNSLHYVRIGAKVELIYHYSAGQHTRPIDLLAMQEGSMAEHLCVFRGNFGDLTDPDDEQQFVRCTKILREFYVEPVSETCQAVIQRLGMKITPRQLIYSLGSIFYHMASSEHFIQPSASNAPASSLLSLIAAPVSGAAQYYSNLVHRSSGEIRQREVVKEVKQLSVHSCIRHMLDYTTIYGFSVRYGRMPATVNGISERFEIGSLHSCYFVLHLPSRPPIHFSAETNYKTVNFDNEAVHVRFKVEKWMVVHGEYNGMNDTMDDNKAALEYLNIPGLSSVDLVIYMALCSNTLKDFYSVTEENETTIWDASSVDDITMRLNNEQREVDHKELKREAQALRKEMGWDGKHHPSFNL